MRAPLEGIGAVAYNGFLYVLGGYQGHFESRNEVQFARIREDGTLGSWASTTPFDGPRYDHGVVANDGFLYVLGGHGAESSNLSDVQYAPIRPDGTLGAWAQTTPFENGPAVTGAPALRVATSIG